MPNIGSRTYTQKQKTQQRMDWSGGDNLSCGDLAANIILTAATDWLKPSQSSYECICFGDPVLDTPACPYRRFYGCYKMTGGCEYRSPIKGGHYFSCLERRSRLKQHLIRFFNSDWYEQLCGDVDPAWLRRKLGIPTHRRERTA